MTDVRASASDLTALHLDVYDTRNRPWNPDHGDIVVPDDWEFLPSGNAFVTRTVKSAGAYWLYWRPRGGADCQCPVTRAARGAISGRTARQIATETAAHAAVVGSGRVGRTRLLNLQERARLAARAHIRHRYTKYEDKLDIAVGRAMP